MANPRMRKADPTEKSGRAKPGNGTRTDAVIRPFYAADESPDAPVHIWVGDRALIVTADVRCMDLEDVSVSVEGSKLILTGSCRPGPPNGRGRIDGDTVHQQVDLPYRVNSGSVEISVDKGFMYVILQREEEQKFFEKPLLEAAIINSVKRYFASGDSSKSRDTRADQLLLDVLQRYFREGPEAAGV